MDRKKENIARFSRFITVSFLYHDAINTHTHKEGIKHLFTKLATIQISKVVQLKSWAEMIINNFYYNVNFHFN